MALLLDKNELRVRAMVALLTRFFGIVLLLALSSACATRIVPPKKVPDPTTVAVINYGRHSSLVLPRETGGSMEYAYGEWKWFAEEKTAPWRVFPALCWSTQGTIGRRPLSFLPSDERALQQEGAKSVICFRVSAAAANRLEHRLDDEFSKSPATLFNPDEKMYFAKVSDSYWGGHNCNTVLARWLKELGCEAKGTALFSDFELSE